MKKQNKKELVKTISKLSLGKHVEPRKLMALSKPILKDMGINTKDFNVQYGRSGTSKIPEGYSGYAYPKQPGLKKTTIHIDRNANPVVQLLTIGHEAKHATDRMARKKNVGKAEAERKAIAFEKRFLKKFKDNYF